MCKNMIVMEDCFVKSNRSFIYKFGLVFLKHIFDIYHLGWLDLVQVAFYIRRLLILLFCRDTKEVFNEYLRATARMQNEYLISTETYFV